MALLKSIQLLRNLNLADNRAAAISSLTGQTAVADGTPVIVRYAEDKAVLGVSYINGATKKYAYVDLNGIDTDTLATKEALAQLKETVDALTGTEGVSKQISDAINALDVTAITKAGEFIQSVSQVDGKVSATTAAVTAAVVTANPVAADTTHVAVAGANVAAQITSLAAAVKSAENKADAVAVTGSNAIKVTDGRAISLVIDPADEVLSQSATGLKANIELVYDKTGTTKEIKLVGKDGSDLGTIDASDFIADGMLDTVDLEGSNLKFTFNTDAGKEDITIDLSAYIKPYTAGNGIGITNNVISAKIKANDPYITVTANGIESKGIDTAIANAVGDAKTEIEDAAADKYITGVTVNSQNAGVVSGVASVNINGSDIAVSATDATKLDAKLASLEAAMVKSGKSVVVNADKTLDVKVATELAKAMEVTATGLDWKVGGVIDCGTF